MEATLAFMCLTVLDMVFTLWTCINDIDMTKKPLSDEIEENKMINEI